MIDIGSLKSAREKRAGPENRESDRSSGTKYHVSGQILVFGSEAVKKPRAHAGTRGGDGAVVHQQQSGPVIGVVGVEGTDNA